MACPAPESRLPSYTELSRRAGLLAGTSWEIFGADDELGTLNLLTPERTRQAADLIQEGIRIGLNLSLDAFSPPLIAHRGNPIHTVFGLNEYHRDDKLDNFYLQASTQIDALRHFAHPDRGFYGGRRPEDINQDTHTLGIGRVAGQGIAGRGLLLDVARYRASTGHPIDHSVAEAITVDDLERTCEWQGVKPEEGDILLLRTGWLDYIRRTSREPNELVTSAGLAAREETAAWLWNNHFSVAAADNIALESWPVSESEIETTAEQSGSLAPSSHTGMLHRILIPLLGLTIGELWDLDKLADECRRRGRYEVFVSAEPLNLPGGVGSPANVLAII